MPAEAPTALRYSPPGAVAPAARARSDFAEVYQTWFGFVWRSARGLGVADAALDDVVQEIFVAVHRKLPDFEGRSSLRTWLSGIALNVVRHHRRTFARKGIRLAADEEPIDPDEQPSPQRDPFERAALSESTRLLERLLDSLDDEKREVLVLAELEQFSIPEIAEALDINVNTAYSRLRLAREQFEAALRRERARHSAGGKRERP
jgi:RNA polymerase sigma-70 factor (ECF subfamily)